MFVCKICEEQIDADPRPMAEGKDPAHGYTAAVCRNCLPSVMLHFAANNAAAFMMHDTDAPLILCCVRCGDKILVKNYKLFDRVAAAKIDHQTGTLQKRLRGVFMLGCAACTGNDT